MRRAKFEIDFYGKKKDQFLQRLVAPNGEILYATEGFKARQTAKNSIKLIKKYAQTAEIVDLTKP